MSSFLKEACAGDEELRREVDLLLARKDQAENFTEGPALEAAAKLPRADSRANLSP